MQTSSSEYILHVFLHAHVHVTVFWWLNDERGEWFLNQLCIPNLTISSLSTHCLQTHSVLFYRPRYVQ